MDFGNSLALSLSFLFLLAHLSHSAIQFSGWLGDNNTYKLFSFSIYLYLCVRVCVTFVKMPMKNCSKFDVVFRQESVLRLNKGAFTAPFDPTRVTPLSWHPRSIALSLSLSLPLSLCVILINCIVFSCYFVFVVLICFSWVNVNSQWLSFIRNF